MSSSGIGNIKIEPVNATWEIEHQEQFDFAGSTAAGLGGKYVLLSSVAPVDYYVWFDENNTDADPAVASRTALPVDYAASAADTAIASAFATAVGGTSGFNATASGTVVTVIRTAVGEVTTSTIGNTTTVTLTECQLGRTFDLGLLQGDVEFGYEETLLEVKAHQTGTTLLADLRQGTVNSITLTLQETHAAALEEMFAKTSGGYNTPGGGTEVWGVGTARIGTNTIVQAARLILQPEALSASDYSRTMCFWKAYPLPESLVFSGENPQTLSVTFKVYKDSAIDENVNLWVFGDYTQYLPV